MGYITKISDFAVLLQYVNLCNLLFLNVCNSIRLKFVLKFAALVIVKSSLV